MHSTTIVKLNFFQGTQPLAASTMEQQRAPNTVSIELPIDFSWGIGVWKFTWNALSALFLQPVLDFSGLLDLSIVLLLLERVGTSLQPFEHKLLPAIVTENGLFEIENDVAQTMVLGSPAIGLFGSLALLFSCFVNSSYSSTTSWLQRGSGTLLLYIILILFCLESILVLSILLIACQALYAEESGVLLLVLFLCWLASLVGSNYARQYLFQQMGD